MDGRDKRLLLMVLGIFGFVLFVWKIVPEFSSFWKNAFLIVFVVGIIVFLEILEKKAKKMGKQTKYPFIRDRHWPTTDQCRREYQELMKLTPKYQQYLKDLGLTNQWEMELDLGPEPDIIYILYKGSNMQANEYLSKLRYCIDYLHRKEVLLQLVNTLAEEIKQDFMHDKTVERRAVEIAIDLALIEENFFNAQKMVFKKKDNDIPYFTIELTQETLEALYKRVQR